jgi:hypothetical protein
MKKSKLFLLGMLIIGIAFGLVLAGCATDSGGGPSAAELAAQLAADINGIEAGKATVSGDTVTLTGGVRLENAALMVPSGVTLDLTTETLQLTDNAIFTVNGTVNAKAEGINIDSAAANPATVNGSGTISLKSKGRMLNIGGNKKLILDGVTLVGLPDNNNSLIVIIEGGEFVMKSGAITGNSRTGEEKGVQGGGVRVEKGIFVMEGGKISGNTIKAGNGMSSGGGVRVNAGSTFTMKGGVISGNTADQGGGVCVESGTFTMEGGTIYGSSEGANANTSPENAALRVVGSTATWGTGGTYTKGGVSQTGGSNIVQIEDPPGVGGTDDTLIAVPAQ